MTTRVLVLVCACACGREVCPKLGVSVCGKIVYVHVSTCLRVLLRTRRKLCVNTSKSVREECLSSCRYVYWRVSTHRFALIDARAWDALVEDLLVTHYDSTYRCAHPHTHAHAPLSYNVPLC